MQFSPNSSPNTMAMQRYCGNSKVIIPIETTF